MYNDMQAIPDGSRDSVTRSFTRQVTEADTFRPIATGRELSTYTIPTLHQHIEHYRACCRITLIWARGLLVVNTGFERSVRREYSHPEAASIPGLYLQLNTIIYDVKYHFGSIAGVGHNWRVLMGMLPGQ